MVATLASAKGESHTKLAEQVGIHRNRLADKIAGRRAFTEEEILKLAEHFGVSPGRLFEDPLELLGVGVGTVRQTAPGLLPSTESELCWSGAIYQAALSERAANVVGILAA